MARYLTWIKVRSNNRVLLAIRWRFFRLEASCQPMNWFRALASQSVFSYKIYRSFRLSLLGLGVNFPSIIPLPSRLRLMVQLTACVSDLYGKDPLSCLRRLRTYRFFYGLSYHLKKAIWLMVYLVDQLHGFSFSNFHLHWRFSFKWEVLVILPL